MIRESRLSKILPVVQECLRHCLNAEDPAREVAQFLERLRSDPAWNDADRQEIETATRRALAGSQMRLECKV